MARNDFGPSLVAKAAAMLVGEQGPGLRFASPPTFLIDEVLAAPADAQRRALRELSAFGYFLATALHAQAASATLMGVLCQAVTRIEAKGVRRG